MEFFKRKTKINFMGQRVISAAFSITLILISLGFFIFKGLNLGLDFVGGTQIEIKFAQPVDVNQIRDDLTAAGFSQTVVQTYGTTRDILIRLGEQHETDVALRQHINKVLPTGTIQSIEYIGPQVGKTL